MRWRFSGRPWRFASLCQVEAQFRQRGLEVAASGARAGAAADFDGRFHFCRVAFSSDFRGDGGNWSVDYPRADLNLSVRLSELTKTDVSRDRAATLTICSFSSPMPELFSCPFIMMTEVGPASFNRLEATALRLYLEKGGFLWADDFWGEFAWQWWEAQIRNVMPADLYPIVDLPPDHPLFQTQFDVKRRRRSHRSGSGPAPAAARPSAAPTAPLCTPAPSSTATAASWC